MIFKDGYVVITPDPATIAESVEVGNVSPKDDYSKVKSVATTISVCSGNSGLEDTRESNEKCKSKLYACPSQGCPRNVDSPRQQFFGSMYSLKMHYRSVHGEKMLKCSKCSKMFGNQVVLSQHERTCMTIYYCPCGSSFKSKNALRMHAKRKQHKINELELNRKKVSSKSICTLPDVITVNQVQRDDTQIEAVPSVVSKGSVGLPRLLRFLPKGLHHRETNNLQQNSELNVVPNVNIRNSNDCLSEKQVEIDSNLTEKTVNYTSKYNTKLSKPNHSSLSSSDVYCSNNKVPHERFISSNLIGDSDNLSLQKLKVVGDDCKPYSVTDVKKKSKNTVHQSIDIFNEISMSAKKLADTFTQTSSMEKIPTLQYPRKVNMNTQTQFDASHFEMKLEKPTTMETQTQINFYIQDDMLMKSTTESQTQVNSSDCYETPETISMDTQTQIDSLNFNEILKKLSMVTQTEISSQYFKDAPTKSSTDVQTQMNSYFDGYSTEVLETSESGVQCHLPTYPMGDNIFPGIDNETQTEPFSSWLSDFECPDFCNMETQTNLSHSLPINELTSNVNVGPIVIDKSIQLEGMMGLNTSDVVLTESSNMSTQTMNVIRDPWLNEDLAFESSSTQTDYFENLDFMDIDFQMEGGDNSVRKFCKDPLISGNVSSEMQVQNNMETQTSISLYDLLDSSLMESSYNSERNMADIETQTSVCYQKYEEQMNDIQTQTTGH